MAVHSMQFPNVVANFTNLITQYMNITDVTKIEIKF